MRVVFRMRGGFAPIPGLAEPIALDVSGLPDRDRAEFERLVARSGFFQAPSKGPVGTAADARSYTITIDDGERSHTVILSDPLPPGDFTAMVDLLRRHALASRRGGPSGGPGG